MVFNSPQPETASESDPKPAPMASHGSHQSLLHQPHNFSSLKWARNTTSTAAAAAGTTKNNNNNNPSEQLSNVTTQLAQLDPGAQRPRPMSFNAEKKADPVPNRRGTIDGRDTQKQKWAAPARKSKLCIKLRAREKPPVAEPEPQPKPEPEAEPEEDKESSIASLADAAEAEDAFQKTWNLRPRRPVVKPNGRAGALQTGAPLVQQNIPPVSGSSSGGPSKPGAKGPKGAKKKDDKMKISLELTREEIEEDLFMMTGARPARRPKKRSKNVQKVLDNLSPGMFLNTVARETYEVPEAPKKQAAAALLGAIYDPVGVGKRLMLVLSLKHHLLLTQ